MKIRWSFRNYFPACTGWAVVVVATCTGPPLTLHSGHRARHSGAGTPRMLWVAATGTCAHKVVTPSHLWAQQRKPRVGADEMFGTNVRHMGMGGTTSACCLRQPGHAIVVAQHAQGLRCYPQTMLQFLCNAIFCVVWVVFN